MSLQKKRYWTEKNTWWYKYTPYSFSHIIEGEIAKHRRGAKVVLFQGNDFNYFETLWDLNQLILSDLLELNLIEELVKDIGEGRGDLQRISKIFQKNLGEVERLLIDLDQEINVIELFKPLYHLYVSKDEYEIIPEIFAGLFDEDVNHINQEITEQYFYYLDNNPFNHGLYSKTVLNELELIFESRNPLDGNFILPDLHLGGLIDFDLNIYRETFLRSFTEPFYRTYYSPFNSSKEVVSLALVKFYNDLKDGNLLKTSNDDNLAKVKGRLTSFPKLPNINASWSSFYKKIAEGLKQRGYIEDETSFCKLFDNTKFKEGDIQLVWLDGYTSFTYLISYLYYSIYFDEEAKLLRFRFRLDTDSSEYLPIPMKYIERFFEPPRIGDFIASHLLFKNEKKKSKTISDSITKNKRLFINYSKGDTAVNKAETFQLIFDESVAFINKKFGRGKG